MTTAQKNGFNFEDKIQYRLETTKLKIYREIDVKRIYGKHVTAIDHLFYDPEKQILICVQDKWLSSKVSNKDFNHFVTCVNTIANDSKKNNYKIILGLYVSNNGLSSCAIPQFDKENEKFYNYETNIKFYDIYENTENILIDKLLYFIHNYRFYAYDLQGDCIMGDYETHTQSYIGDYYNDCDIIMN